MCRIVSFIGLYKSIFLKCMGEGVLVEVQDSFRELRVSVSLVRIDVSQKTWSKVYTDDLPHFSLSLLLW